MRGSLEKISTQVLQFIPLVLAFLTPLFFLPITVDAFNFNKLYLVSFLASLSMIAWCLRSLVRGKLTVNLSPSLLPLLFLALAFVISSVWLSPTKHASLFGQTTLTVSLFIIFVSVTSLQKSVAVINSVIFGLVTSAATLSLITILHRFDLLTRIFSSDLLTNKSFNLTGGILPALAFTLPVFVSSVAYLIIHRNRLTKSLLFAASIIMIVASLINLTLIFPQNGQSTLFLLPFRAGWSIAIDTLKSWQTALLGTGPDTFLTTFTRLRPSYLNTDNLTWIIRFPESSNYIFTLITTTGIIGTLSFLSAFIRPVCISIKHCKANTDNPAYVFLSLALISVLISFFAIPAGTVTLILGIVLLIALTAEFDLLELKNIQNTDLKLSRKTDPSKFTLMLPSVILTFASTFLLSVYWYYALPTYSASMSARQAEALITTNPVGAYLKEINAAKLDPYNVNYALSLSQFFKSLSLVLLNKKDATADDKKNATDYMQKTIDYGKQAALLDPYNVIVWENLADIYQSFIGFAEGAHNFAISHLAQAIALDQSNPHLRLKLGILFFNLGDSDQAIKLLNQAIELKQNWAIPYYNISAIYKLNKDYSRALQYIQASQQYTSPASTDFAKVQDEIKSIEKLLTTPTTPTPTPTPSKK